MQLKETLEKIIKGFPVAKQETDGVSNANSFVIEHKNLQTDLKEYLVKGKLIDQNYIVNKSFGQGRWATVPWIAILDNRVTKRTQTGFYIAYLFSVDGKRVYLSLTQGVTDIDHKPQIVNRANLYYDMIKTDIDTKKWSSGHIDLSNGKDKLTDLPKDYEMANIIHKEYTLDNMPNEKIIISDLKKLLEIYKKLADKSKLIAQNLQVPDEKEPENILDDVFLKKIDVPRVGKSQPSQKTTNNANKSKKMSTAKRNEQNNKFAEIGLRGEELVYREEKSKLEKAGRKDLADKVEHVSLKNDSLGYDIVSYEIDEKTKKEMEIFIEVKTTESKTKIASSFYLSENEKQTWIKHSEKYRLYRVVIEGNSGEYYIADNLEQLVLVPVSYECHLNENNS